MPSTLPCSKGSMQWWLLCTLISLDSHSRDHPGSGQEKLPYSFLHLQGVPLCGHTMDYVCLLFSHTRLCATPWTAAWQASLAVTTVKDTGHILWLESLSHVWLCNPVGCSTSGFPVLHYFLELTQTHVHWVGDATQSSHSLLPPSPALTLSQHQGLLQWVSSSHQVVTVWELQLQHQSFQWITRVDFL